MKELSIKEKAKAYDEAIKIAKSKIKNDKNHVLYETDVIEIFPELKESEEKPNGGIVLEDFNEGDGFYKVNLAYLSKEQVEEIESIVKKWNHKPSELDEKIRKEIIKETKGSEVRLFETVTNDEFIAWLRRHGEQMPAERKDFISIPFGAYDSELVEESITIPDVCYATIEGNKIHIKKK